MLTLALPKGRLLAGAVAALGRAGLRPSEDPETTRRLVLEGGAAEGKPVRFLLLKDSDVPLYVERGVADCGIAGTDKLRESGASLLEPLDLGFGRCRLVIAAPEGRPLEPPPGRSLRVATRFARLAAQAFAARAVPVDLLVVSGSVELTAVTGLADAIVDLVETGATLRANGLTERETILESSARLVVNRAAFRLKGGEVRALIEALEGRRAAA